MKPLQPHMLWNVMTSAVLAASALIHTAQAQENKGATRAEAVIWAGGEIYDTIATPTEFSNPPAKSTDVLYNFMASGLEGQRPISEAAPGDADYNGGRWSVVLVVFTDQGLAAHDPDGDGHVNFELKSEEDVMVHIGLGHLVVSDPVVYFECPLLPRRNR